jgi:hypothetical protein
VALAFSKQKEKKKKKCLKNWKENNVFSEDFYKEEKIFEKKVNAKF